MNLYDIYINDKDDTVTTNFKSSKLVSREEINFSNYLRVKFEQKSDVDIDFDDKIKNRNAEQSPYECFMMQLMTLGKTRDTGKD